MTKNRMIRPVRSLMSRRIEDINHLSEREMIKRILAGDNIFPFIVRPSKAVREAYELSKVYQAI